MNDRTEHNKPDLKNLPYAQKGDLTTGPIENHLVRLTIPMIWGLLAIISVQLVDTFWISMLGTEPLAAISFTFPVTMIVSHLLFGMNVAMSSVISRLIGEKREEDVKRVALHGILFAVILAGLFALVTYLCLDLIFSSLGADAGMRALIREYMVIWLVASVIIAVPMNGNSAIRAAGNTTLPAIVMVSVALVNLVLDPLFIFGLMGLPAMGLAGAATATLIAYGWGLLLGLYFLVVKKKLIPLNGLHLDKLRNSARRLFVIALPAGITNIIQPLTGAVIVSLLAQHGPEAVAGYGIASRIEAFALLIVVALAIGMAPIVGQNWGAQNYGRVHKTINLAIMFNFIWSFSVALLLGLFAQPIASLFSDDPAVIEVSVLFFWIVPFSYAFANLVFGWSSAFNAMGMPKRAFAMITITYLVLIIPGVHIGSYLYGVTGVLTTLAAIHVFAGLGFHWLSRRACTVFEERRAGALQAA